MESSQDNTEKKFKEYLEEQLQPVVLDSSPDAKVIKTKGRGSTKPVPQHVQKIELNAQAIQEKNELMTNAFDGRSQVLTTAKWPNSAHGVITFKVNNIKTWGTGILIAPHIVLTAGHNLYDLKSRVYYEVQDMQFLPGMNGQVLPFGVIEVEKSLVSPNYIKEGREDYGILILKEPIGEMTGYFGLACLEPEEMKAKTINITGYPGDKVASKPNTYEMWGMEGTVASIDQIKGIINYLIDTGAGQSGSGVWYKEGEDYYVCGVHATGTPVVNKATFLTRAMYKQIYAWANQVDFKEHLLELKSKKYLEFPNQEINVRCVSLLLKYNLDVLTVLNLNDKKIGDEGVKTLAQNTSWRNLWLLSLTNNHIGEEGAKALAQNISWMNLSVFSLSNNKIGAKGAKALAQNFSWSNLSMLDLYDNKIGIEGAQALSQNTFWINLSILYLPWNNIGGEGARALAQNIFWRNLLELNLESNNIDAEGAKALAQNTSWTRLHDLILNNNDIGVEGAKALAQNTSWIKLSHLRLQGNKIGTEGAKALAENISWVSLSSLQLSANHCGVEGAKALTQNTSWTKLKHLNFSRNDIGVEGAKALTQNTSWTKLKHLNFSRNDIGVEGAKALAQNTSWTNLRELDLSSNDLGVEGATALAQSTSWTKLEKLNLSCNNLGAEGAKALALNTSWINLSSLLLQEDNIGPEEVTALKQNKTWKNNNIRIST